MNKGVLRGLTSARRAQSRRLRYFPISRFSAITNAATSSNISRTPTGDLDPTGNTIPLECVALHVELMAQHGAVSSGFRYNVYGYGAANFAGQCFSGKLANHWEALQVFYVPTGGINNREVEIEVDLGGVAGTAHYYLDVYGYWVYDE